MTRQLTYGSLFAGIGGIDLGFDRAGMRCAWQVEIDPFCRRVLAKHWPDVPKWDDVRTFPPEPLERWTVDVIAGGDPCQGNSNAGSIHKKQHADLGSEFVRVVGLLRPRIVVRENPHPSRSGAVWPWWRMRSALAGVGYAVLPFRLRSCCLGAYHRRDRVFLLGELADANREPNAMQRRAATSVATCQVSHQIRQQWLRVNAGTALGDPVLRHADGLRLEGLDRHWEPSRHVGGARNDSVPAPRICRSRNEVPYLVDRLRALGNAVDPVVSEWIGRRIVAAAGGEE